MNPTRVLCLHGRYQNGRVFQQKIASITFRSVFRNQKVIFDFLDGPYTDVPPVFKHGVTAHYRVTHTQLKDSKYLAWWPPRNRDNFEHIYTTLVDYLKQHDYKQYDGIIGFSQGAAFGSVLCTEEMTKQLEWGPKFAVFFCGNLPTLVFPKEYTSNYIKDLPSLHVIGIQDQIIPFQSSLQVYNAMKQTSPTIKYLLHPNGHVIPTDHATLHSITDFIQQHVS